MYSKHPYDPYIPQNATKLIIGTMPPYRFCIDPKKLFGDDVNFYYGSRDNYFWDLIAEATDTQLDRDNSEVAVDQRKALLTKLNIGITDVIEQCLHKNGKSDDASLQEITLKPLTKLLSQYPQIDTLLYTSQNIIKYVNQMADKSYHRWEKPRRKGSISINNKNYSVVVLYSPSPLARRRVSQEAQLSQYKDVFGEICLPIHYEQHRDRYADYVQSSPLSGSPTHTDVTISAVSFSK